ncbi:aminotransferase, class III [Ophiobolus disseminans]|uniref:Aminotransferase, class III n=1 Tax=Ophiobolus disseminans TaxID=1469910 RepID=A0A6A7A5N5_9PLEO|nr:aminotransferase, class III [Ophiobolus disseminans]
MRPKRPLFKVERGEGNEYVLEDGTCVYDAAGGAAVSCIGRADKRVEKAMVKQFRKGISYLPSLSFYAQVSVDLANWLVDSTDGKMAQVMFYGSGSNGIDAAQKLARQYHKRAKLNPEEDRIFFIARDRSYHGATLDALDLSGHKARRAYYEPMLAKNMRTVPPCYPYRERLDNETDAAYVQRLKQALVDMIETLGPTKVAGFIVEPVVGAALGCVAAVDGYLAAMREVCDKYDILLIFDEIMCGLGRTGYMHAWQKSGVVPDIQLIGKGLAGGFAEISGMLVGHKVAKAFKGSGEAFAHGHTFQNHPLACAMALATLKIIDEDRLLENVRQKGPILARKLRERLGSHPYVGDIRGEGLFWAIEFVMDKLTKTPFESKLNIADEIHRMGLTKQYAVWVYPGSGTVDGTDGDHIILAPAFNITEEEVDIIVERTATLIEDYFKGLDESMPSNS